VNTAFVNSRRGAIEGIGSTNWDKVFGSLFSWNALLPRMKDDDGNLKYRIRISDIEYQKLTEINSEAQCNKCEAYTDYTKIHVFDLLVPLMVQILSGEKTSKVWICPKCKDENIITETDILENHLQEPYYLGVVPKPPHRKEGLSDRGAYDRKVTAWAWNLIAELEEKSTQFREDYKENKNDFEAWEEETDGGEEE
jgi:hypothetical protein